MMKKLCYLFLVISTILCLCACGENSSKKIFWRDIASTDIADISIDKAEFSVYAYSTTGGAYLKPTAEKTYYGAPVGKSLVIISFTITNKDRVGSLSLGPMDWKIRYKNKEYDIKGFTNVKQIMEDGITFNPASVIDRETESGQTETKSSNVLVNSGATKSYRVIGMVDVEPDSLEDKYELKIKLRNSKGKYEEFTVLPGYTDEQKEILYNTGINFLTKGDYYYAMNKFREAENFSDAKEKYEEAEFLYYFGMPYQSIAQEYFAAKREQYALLNETDIKSQIVGEWINSNNDSKIVFSSNGTVVSRYKTNGKWEVADNKLKFTEFGGDTPEICEVRKIKEGMYLFFRNSTESFMSLKKDK